jgi:heat shock protein HslJ
MNRLFMLCVLLLSLLLTACGTGSSVTPSPTVPPPTQIPTQAPSASPTIPPPASLLAGSKWQLVAFDLSDIHHVILKGSLITLEFAQGQLNGHGGCNGYGGDYTADASTLKVGPLMSTMMACADDKMTQQESAYTNALGKAASYTIKDNELSITYDGGILRYVRQV